MESRLTCIGLGLAERSRSCTPPVMAAPPFSVFPNKQTKERNNHFNNSETIKLTRKGGMRSRELTGRILPLDRSGRRKRLFRTRSGFRRRRLGLGGAGRHQQLAAAAAAAGGRRR